MNIEEIKAWLGQGEDEENRPNWPVTKEKLIEALVTVGIPEETAKSMFTSADPSLRILQEITNDTRQIFRRGTTRRRSTGRATSRVGISTWR